MLDGCIYAPWAFFVGTLVVFVVYVLVSSEEIPGEAVAGPTIKRMFVCVCACDFWPMKRGAADTAPVVEEAHPAERVKCRRRRRNSSSSSESLPHARSRDGKIGGRSEIAVDAFF